MRLWTKVLAFDWDTGNLHKNKLKFNVTNQEAEEVFSNEPLIVSEDKKHSTKREERYQALGKTNNKRKLFLSFTIRNNRIRVISIRDMNKKEKVIYEHN
jgi:uncharacterized DUF497 family protein